MTAPQRLGTALFLNALLVAGEVVAGVLAHSTALFADAGHNLSDVAAIVVSLGALRWSLRPRSDARTYGNHRGTILAALANASLLAVVTCAIVVFALVRLVHPTTPDGALVMAVAGAALVVNGAASLALRDRSRDLNMRSVALHMSADVLASAAVLVAGAFEVALGPIARSADPAASLAVAGLILYAAVRLARESASVLLESTPGDVDLATLRTAMTEVPRVGEVHDLHVWSLSADYRALSAHLVLTGHPTLEEAQAVGGVLRDKMVGRFGIAHTTFEMECERCEEDADLLHAPPSAKTRRSPE